MKDVPGTQYLLWILKASGLPRCNGTVPIACKPRATLLLTPLLFCAVFRINRLPLHPKDMVKLLTPSLYTHRKGRLANPSTCRRNRSKLLRPKVPFKSSTGELRRIPAKLGRTALLTCRAGELAATSLGRVPLNPLSLRHRRLHLPLETSGPLSIQHLQSQWPRSAPNALTCLRVLARSLPVTNDFSSNHLPLTGVKDVNKCPTLTPPKVTLNANLLFLLSARMITFAFYPPRSVPLFIV